MAELTINGLHKVYGNSVEAVKDFSIKIEDGEFIVIVGPSGCGKSTILRMVAGLEKPSSGELLLDGMRINDLSPQKRDMAMVFQGYALYENMTVFDNIAFPLKMRKEKQADIASRVNDTASLLKISDLLKRKPKTLSGGEKQRVAMGRAIVREPKLFLMDEPLSNLDAKLRLELRNEIKQLQKRLKVTTIYVTHDQGEAMSMADRVVIMNHGEVQQIGRAKELYDSPANPFVAGFFGNLPMNLWRDDGKTYGIRPEDILLSKTCKQGWTEAAVLSSCFNGNQWTEEVTLNGMKITVCSSEEIRDGEVVYLKVPDDKIFQWQ